MTGFIRPEALIFAALKGLVQNRVYPTVFTQDPQKPKWPAIRYVRVSTVPDLTICGSGDDDTADVDFQIDVVAANNADLVALQQAVKAAMAGILDPVPVWTGEGVNYDFETRTHRCTLEYTFYPSSEGGG